MSFKKLLIANRGEIAIRIARAAAELGIATVAVHSADDARRCMSRVADEAVEIPGPRRARLSRYRSRDRGGEGDRLRCDPSRLRLPQRERRVRAGLRRGGHRLRRADAGGAGTVRRQGAGAGAGEALRRAGDRRAPSGADRRSTRPGVLRVARPGAAIMIKAMAGGGGRGMRVVEDAGRARGGLCALPVRGEGGVRQRRRLCRAADPQRAPHRGADHRRPARRDRHLWERECTIQRRHQKLIEIAPGPSLNDALRGRIIEAAVQLADGRELRQPRHLRVPGRRDAAERQRSPSSRPIRGCRSSTP